MKKREDRIKTFEIDHKWVYSKNIYHRGKFDNVKVYENTMEAYKAALADMIELDIQGWLEDLGEEADLTASELSNIKNTISSIVESTDLSKFTAKDIEDFKNGIRDAVIQIEDLKSWIDDYGVLNEIDIVNL